MAYYEMVGNLHVHTTYSDGVADHETLAGVANGAGLDFLIVTDHNVYAGEKAGWRGRTLLLVGEEVHNPERDHANHLLVLGAGESLVRYRQDPQALIRAVGAHGGLSYIAHPYEHSGAYISEPEINWVDWGVSGYTGLEIWNYMSEFKARLPNAPTTLLHVFWPRLAIAGPFPETLARWDALLAQGRVAAIGGSDAHGATYRLGPLRRAVFGYKHLFGALNTHVLVVEPWNGDVAHDTAQIYEALRHGRAFVGYDGLARTDGFCFTATRDGREYAMGDEMPLGGQISFEARAPARAYLRLLRNGHCVAEARGRALMHRDAEPGAYRVEVLRRYAFRRRGWIYSNPIYVRG
jgi:hypothetical protein